MTQSRISRRVLNVEALVLGSYVLLTLIFTYPLILHLDSYVVGLEGDVEQHLWSFWWMRKALLELHTNPFMTYWLYYPQGASLYFFAYNSQHAVLSIPLQALFGVIAAYNIMSLLTFIAAAYATYWLARDVTGSRAASFIAGIVFGFAPTQLFHFNLGQANLHGVEFLPVYVLCLRRWLAGGRTRWLLGGAIALALSSFSDWQFAVYLQLFTAVALLAALLSRREAWRAALWELGWRTAALETLYAIAVAPVVVPMLLELSSPRPYMFRSRDDTAQHAADLLAFFVPNPAHPLWGDWAQQQLSRLIVPGFLVTVVSLSYVALALAILGALYTWQKARFWVFSGFVFIVLSLGPQLRLLGRETPILLPYELLWHINIIKISRVPARYAMISLLCLAVLAAIGVQALLAYNRRQKASNGQDRSPMRRDIRRWSFVAIMAALCFELLPVPAQAEPAPPAPAFFTDGTLRDAGALLEVPHPSNRGMFYAMIHDRPVLYGELSRDNPVRSELAYLRRGLFKEDTREMFDYLQNWLCSADAYDITHLVIYHTGQPEAIAAKQFADERLGPQALVSDAPLASLYRLPSVDQSSTCVFLGEGWDQPRKFAGGQDIYRWTAQQARIGLLRHRPGRVTLRFSVHSFAIPRQLQVRRDGHVLGQFPVGGEPAQPVEIELDLPAGLTWLDLASLEPATSPADYGYKETDPIAIGYSRLSVHER